MLSLEDLVIDKEFEELLPILKPEEFERLEQSVLKNGMLDPIKVWEEPNTGRYIIIDGHNRYNILKKNNLGFKYWEDYKIMYTNELPTRNDVKRWMLEQQLGRRNLSIDEKYEIVQKFKDIFKQRAKDNQSAGGKGLVNLPKVNTRLEMAKATGVSEKTYDKLDKVMQSDNTELKQKIHNKEMSIDKAYKLLRSQNNREISSLKTPIQKIEEVDNRIADIESETKALSIEKQTLLKKRLALYNDLDIKCIVQYEINDKNEAVFFIELDGKKKILLEQMIIFCDEPGAYDLSNVPDNFKNDIRMLWESARNAAIDKLVQNSKTNYRQENYNSNFKKEFYKKSVHDDKIRKTFYKKCFKILALKLHPDAGGTVEDMQLLNELKNSLGI